MPCTKHGYTNHVICPMCDAEQVEQYRRKLEAKPTSSFVDSVDKDIQIKELAMFVKRLALSVKADGNVELSSSALSYLKQNNLMGSTLRDDNTLT